MVRLGDVCDILNGFAFKSSNYVLDGGIRVIRIANVQDGYVSDEAPQFYPIGEMQSLGKYLLYENDLLMSLTGNVGRVALLSKDLLPAALNQRVACLRPSRDINKKFLFHFLHNPLFVQDCIKAAKGVAQLNMSTEWLKEFPIPLPPLEEQQRIVAELDRINAVMEDCRQLLRTLDDIAQSLFYDSFGDPISNPKAWPINKLGEMNTILSAKRVLVQDVVETGIPFIRGTELAILSKQISFDKSVFSMFITEEHYQKVKAITGVPTVFDLLIPSINPDGNIWEVNTTDPFYFKDGRVLWIKVNHEKFESKWLRFALTLIPQHYNLTLFISS